MSKSVHSINELKHGILFCKLPYSFKFQTCIQRNETKDAHTAAGICSFTVLLTFPIENGYLKTTTWTQRHDNNLQNHY